MKKVICFGAAGGGKRLFEEISSQYDILCFCDNDSRKWETECCGLRVYEPGKALQMFQYEYVIVTSAPGMESIKQQLLKLGVEERKIVTRFVDAPLKSRILFLQKYAELYGDRHEGCCAEAGVFQGDFAKEINVCFPDRRLYLFDTFSGFDKKDIEKEGKLSAALEGDYNNTSEDLVLAKMQYPANCRICKGYFPQSAVGTEAEREKYLFVNLDLDLYEPTYQGLCFFEKKMSVGGVILIHDYFATNFKGPKQAAERFLSERHGYTLLPIGDGISVAVTGFKN